MRNTVLLLATLMAGCGRAQTADQAQTTNQTPAEEETPVADRTEIGVMEFPEGSVQHVVLDGEMPWATCPPNLPSGCEIAVLEGNPQAPDLFTVRFRVGGSFVMRPHTHPRDERVTVLSGSVAVAFGEDATRDSATTFGPGDYYVNARDAVHAVWADEPSVIQITGIGPWEARFVADAGN